MKHTLKSLKVQLAETKSLLRAARLSQDEQILHHTQPLRVPRNTERANLRATHLELKALERQCFEIQAAIDAVPTRARHYAKA